MLYGTMYCVPCAFFANPVSDQFLVAFCNVFSLEQIFRVLNCKMSGLNKAAHTYSIFAPSTLQRSAIRVVVANICILPCCPWFFGCSAGCCTILLVLQVLVAIFKQLVFLVLQQEEPLLLDDY